MPSMAKALVMTFLSPVPPLFFFINLDSSQTFLMIVLLPTSLIQGTTSLKTHMQKGRRMLTEYEGSPRTQSECSPIIQS